MTRSAFSWSVCVCRASWCNFLGSQLTGSWPHTYWQCGMSGECRAATAAAKPVRLSCTPDPSWILSGMQWRLYTFISLALSLSRSLALASGSIQLGSRVGKMRSAFLPALFMTITQQLYPASTVSSCFLSAHSPRRWHFTRNGREDRTAPSKKARRIG